MTQFMHFRSIIVQNQNILSRKQTGSNSRWQSELTPVIHKHIWSCLPLYIPNQFLIQEMLAAIYFIAFCLWWARKDSNLRPMDYEYDAQVRIGEALRQILGI